MKYETQFWAVEGSKEQWSRGYLTSADGGPFLGGGEDTDIQKASWRKDHYNDKGPGRKSE